MRNILLESSRKILKKCKIIVIKWKRACLYIYIYIYNNSRIARVLADKVTAQFDKTKKVTHDNKPDF